MEIQSKGTGKCLGTTTHVSLYTLESTCQGKHSSPYQVSLSSQLRKKGLMDFNHHDNYFY